MKKHKPTLLILTSSFPSSYDDETCGYVRDFARYLTLDFDVQILTPADAKASDTNQYPFQLIRSKSFLPKRLDPLQAGRDLNQLVSSNLFSKILTLISLFAFFINAAKLARRTDVICSHWMLPSGLIGAILAGIFRKPQTVIEHSGALHLLLRSPGGRKITRFIVRRSYRVITVSRELKNKLIALCPEAQDKTQVIAMGISLAGVNQKLTDAVIISNQGHKRNIGSNTPAESPELPAQHSNKTADTASENKILFIGRLIEIKGVEVLLKALATLPDVQLLMAGNGSQRIVLERLAEKLNINAVFLGHVDKTEKARLFALSTMVVIPSLILPDGRTEGMPVVALEALAAGVPLIASRVGGLSEIIIDGQNGLLFESGDQAQLACKIKLLLNDENLREQLSVNARQTAESYDWQIIGAKFSQIIKDSLGTNGSVESYQTASNLKH